MKPAPVSKTFLAGRIEVGTNYPLELQRLLAIPGLSRLVPYDMVENGCGRLSQAQYGQFCSFYTLEKSPCAAKRNLSAFDSFFASSL